MLLIIGHWIEGFLVSLHDQIKGFWKIVFGCQVFISSASDTVFLVLLYTLGIQFIPKDACRKIIHHRREMIFVCTLGWGIMSPEFKNRWSDYFQVSWIESMVVYIQKETKRTRKLKCERRSLKQFIFHVLIFVLPKILHLLLLFFLSPKQKLLSTSKSL